MFGTVAHYRLKPGTEEQMLDIEREFREGGMQSEQDANIAGLSAKFAIRVPISKP
jgi:hypothetical protein